VHVCAFVCVCVCALVSMLVRRLEVRTLRTQDELMRDKTMEGLKADRNIPSLLEEIVEVSSKLHPLNPTYYLFISHLLVITSRGCTSLKTGKA
jgi:hypothetical protein